MLHESIKTYTDQNGFEKAIYPSCCQSASCGGYGDSCNSCKCYPILKSFNDWVSEKKAIVKDWVWSPSVYIATIK